MKKLFSLLLHNESPQLTRETLLEFLNTSEIELLLKHEILIEGKHLQVYQCAECGNGNPVLFDKNEKPYTVCSCDNGGRTNLSETDIKRFKISVVNLIRYIFQDKSLSATCSSSKLWILDSIMIRGVDFSRYLWLSEDEHIGNTEKLSDYSIVFYMGDTKVVDNSVVYISLPEITDKVLKIPSDTVEDYIYRYVRFIDFTADGRVFLYKREITSIPPNTPQYIFFELLYDHYGRWFNNDEIYKYVKSEYKKRTGHGYGLSNEDDFSKSMVREIKRITSDKNAISRIIQNNRKTGYRVSDPA